MMAMVQGFWGLKTCNSVKDVLSLAKETAELHSAAQGLAGFQTHHMTISPTSNMCLPSSLLTMLLKLDSKTLATKGTTYKSSCCPFTYASRSSDLTSRS